MRSYVTFTKSNKILPPFPRVKIFGNVAPHPPISEVKSTNSLLEIGSSSSAIIF